MSSSDDDSSDSAMFTPEDGEPKAKRPRVDWLSPRRDSVSKSAHKEGVSPSAGARLPPSMGGLNDAPALQRLSSHVSSHGGDFFDREEIREGLKQSCYRRLLPEFPRKLIRGGFLGRSELVCVDKNTQTRAPAEPPNGPTSAPSGEGGGAASSSAAAPKTPALGTTLLATKSLGATGRNVDHPLAFARTMGSWRKYERMKTVGQGAYGKVYEARNCETGEIVAAKVTTKLDDEDGAANLSFIREVQVLRRVKGCKSCVQLVEMAVTSKNEPVIVMEYCHASLEHLLQSEKHVLFTGNVGVVETNFCKIKYLLQQVLDGVGYMHSLGILHRDLASKNILFNISGEVKVCDFGISRMAFGDHTWSSRNISADSPRHKTARADNLEPPQLCVTLPYRSIELLLGERKYGPALDMWGVGCILAEILIQKGGVSKKPMFYPESGVTGENANKPSGWQVVAGYILSIVGRPSPDTWPRFEHLLKNFSGFEGFDAQIRGFPRHRSKGDEAKFLADYFRNGKGRALVQNRQLDIRPGTFTLLGGLLALNPDERLTARGALDDAWFAEKPLPVWDHELFRILGTGVAEAASKAKDDERKKRQYLQDLQNISAQAAAAAAPPGQRGAADPRARLEEKREQAERAERAERDRAAGEPRGGADPREHPGRTGGGVVGGGDHHLPRGHGLPDLRAKKASNFSSAPSGRAAEKPNFDENVSRRGKKLPSGWVRAWSKSKEDFFYAQPATKKSQWVTPK